MLVGGKPATTEPLVTATSCSSKALLAKPIAEGAVAGEFSGLWHTPVLCQSTFSTHGEGHWIIECIDSVSRPYQCSGTLRVSFTHTHTVIPSFCVKMFCKLSMLVNESRSSRGLSACLSPNHTQSRLGVTGKCNLNCTGGDYSSF